MAGHVRSLEVFAAVMAASAALHGFAHTTQAQWQVINLHAESANPDPRAGVPSSQAGGISAAQQVGIIGYPHCFGCPTPTYACMWSGTAGSYVNLHPKQAGLEFSWAHGASGAQQAGYVSLAGAYHASLWSGTAESWVDLHPAGATYSFANDIFGSQQVGQAGFDGWTHAGLWTGSAESWIDLHPAAATSSFANATSGAQQVGYTQIGTGAVYHASLWSGTAASFVDLNPAGAATSFAMAVSGSQQAGGAQFGNVHHAGVWSGSAESWVDFHPPGATYSRIYGTTGALQVGQADTTITRACVWYGTAASRVDLSACLPAGFSHTDASAVWTDGTTAHIAGKNVNLNTGRTEALLWIIPAQPCPTNIVNSATSVFRVDVDDLLAVITGWGLCPAPTALCPANVNNSGASANRVDVDDLLAVISGWGNCP